MGAIYTGVTNNLGHRMEQHQSRSVRGHTAKYNIHMLVWYEVHDDLEQARLREKRIKGWRRAWKLELIDGFNPVWRDLAFEVLT
jgi:putative endonuclease